MTGPAAAPANDAAPHQLVVTVAPGRDIYLHPASGRRVAHHTDALCRLARELVAAGYGGSAEVHGEDGRLRMTVPSLDRLAGMTMTEGDRGARHRKWKPADPAVWQAA